MFHHLRRNGYYTVGIGKISHYVDGCLYGYEAPENRKNRNYLIVGMRNAFRCRKRGNGWNAFFRICRWKQPAKSQKQVKPYECADVADEGYPDGLTANLAVKKLNELTAKNEAILFLLAGFSSLIYLSHLLKNIGICMMKPSIPISPYARHSGRMRSGQPA